MWTAQQTGFGRSIMDNNWGISSEWKIWSDGDVALFNEYASLYWVNYGDIGTVFLTHNSWDECLLPKNWFYS